MTDQTPTHTEAQSPKKWGKGKLAATFGGGCCGLSILVLIIGIIGAAITGDLGADPEPAATTTETAETTEPEPEEAPEPEEEATTDETPAEPTEEETTEATPEPTEEDTPDPEPTQEPTEEPTGTEATTEDQADDTLTRAEDIQSQLDVWFDGCTWETATEGDLVMTNCAEHEIGIIVGPGDSSVQHVLDAMGEQATTGGYIIEDGMAVWSTDMGNVRMAWDVLGTPGTPTEF